MNRPLEIVVADAARAHGRSIRAGDRTANWFVYAWSAAQKIGEPYRHWLLRNALPHDVARAIAALPIAASGIGDTLGKRDGHNSSRTFFSPAMRAEYPVCNEVAAAFQKPETVAAIEQATGSDFSGSYLRIEFCQDTDGFWLEPHTDIGAKLLTLSVFLSDAPGSEDWGTDIYSDGGTRHAGRVPSGFNEGFAFVPGTDTWHGVEKRPFTDVRRSIIVNYVKPEWRSRHELAYPERAVG